MIPYGKHSVDKDDVDAVVDILENQFLTQGPKTGEFESALCDITGARFATSVNSGTSALHVACLALGVGPGDVVWTVPNSFVASANCALYCGASADFVDIDPLTRNISVHALRDKLNAAEQNGSLPKVLVVVHFAGLSCDMQAIRGLTQQHNIAVIEDASHALGGSYQGEPVGNCKHSELCVFSFHPVKSITTAEGGAIMCNEANLAKKVVSYAKHGITRDTTEFQHFDKQPWAYEQHRLGYNYRLSDLHAALGLNQLKKLPEFITRREHIALRYLEKLAELPVKLPVLVDYAQSAWHLFVIEVQQHQRETVFKQLIERGIAVNVHYIPIHIQPFYQQQGFVPGDFPDAVKYYDNAISLPIFPLLTEKEQDYVINALCEVLA